MTSPRRIFCIGRNYAEHVKELQNPPPPAPVIFIKPASCLVLPGEPIHFPRHGKVLHHEVEIVMQIGKKGKPQSEADAMSFVNALAIGLDLTLRDVQDDLKKRGMPWEISKAFDQSAPVGGFFPMDPSIDLKNISFGCAVNGSERQKGNSGDMLFPLNRLIAEIGKIWTLYPGDLIFTGTPAGVGPLRIGDSVEIWSDKTGSYSWKIIG